jgi:hypothetical protein
VSDQIDMADLSVKKMLKFYYLTHIIYIIFIKNKPPMKEYIDNINWSEIWAFSKQFILPNIGWFVLWLVLFLILGLVMSIFLNRYLYKKNLFTRDRKYYNWIAKLWIPYIVIVCLYFFGMFGLLYGSRAILTNENKSITASLYSHSLGTTFSTEAEKKAFLSSVQSLSNSSEDASQSMTKTLADYIKKSNTGMASVDHFKDASSSFLLQKYESEVYSACVFGCMKAVDSKADMHTVKNVGYAEFKSLLKKLDQIEPQKIEQSIQAEMGRKLQKAINLIYNEIMKHEIFFFLLFLAFPFIEFLIYVKFVKMKPQEETTQV